MGCDDAGCTEMDEQVSTVACDAYQAFLVLGQSWVMAVASVGVG